jgi:hypothetical protein
VTKPVDKDSLPLDKPRRTPGHPTKSHVVKTNVDGKEKIIRFGEQGAETAGKPKANESDRMKQKRASFKARHGESIAKGKSSAAWWAAKVKWTIFPIGFTLLCLTGAHHAHATPKNFGNLSALPAIERSAQ